MLEADIMRQEQLKASERGDRLFRNNVGVLIDRRGTPVHFGLHIGSGDLIGWRRVEITQEMVGKTMAIFHSAEIKTKKGKLTQAQIDWRDAVNAAGGIGEVIYGD